MTAGQLMAALIGSASLLCAGRLIGAAPAGENSPARIVDADLPAWVEQHVAAWEPTREERRFDMIGWARDIRDAERLARQHGRPVFLFTHDGRMATGRC